MLKKALFKSFLFISAMFITGCAAMAPPTERIAFPEEEYLALPQKGTAIVRGQAFLKTRGGDVKTAAGEEVHLNPVTSYSEQWYLVTFRGGKALTKADPRYHQYIKTTTADGDGRFTFSNVPAGEYYLVTRVLWEAPGGGVLTQQGGLVMKKIRVQDGDELDVVITR